MEKNKTNILELLAIESSFLSNERTLLAYSRTFIVFLSSGFAILKIETFKDLEYLGYLLVFLSPLIMGIGIFRFFNVKNKIKKIEIDKNLDAF